MEWINTQIILPKENMDVLFTQGESVMYGHLKNGTKQLWINGLEMTGFGYAEVYGVTHWMELPQPPNNGMEGTHNSGKKN